MFRSYNDLDLQFRLSGMHTYRHARFKYQAEITLTTFPWRRGATLVNEKWGYYWSQWGSDSVKNIQIVGSYQELNFVIVYLVCKRGKRSLSLQVDQVDSMVAIWERYQFNWNTNEEATTLECFMLEGKWYTRIQMRNGTIKFLLTANIIGDVILCISPQ